MEPFFSRVRSLALMSMSLISVCTLSDCYDPLDPNGNITVTFDINQWTRDGYEARVTIQNYYHYRHVDKSGWKLGWTWANNEIIWTMSGAFATTQGNCSSFKFDTPHSCEKSPVIADLTPDALPENRTADCCHGGILAAWAIDPSMSFSSFEMMVGHLGANPNVQAPLNLTLMAPGPGYTCGLVADTDPTISSDIGGRRQLQAYRTWKSTCTYSSFVANQAPVCCVSLSTFYNSKITSCPTCSCGCREAEESTGSCIREGYPAPQSDSLDSDDIVLCTDHMCPVTVHWHVMKNYVTHWKVKLTVSNYNYRRNYSNWNVLAQHPGFSQNATAFSFNSTMLPSFGFSDEVALFWGIDYYNNDLLNADKDQLGAVSTQILLKKDSNSFTLKNGWALPRRIYFNGENCQMPLPDTFPMLPNGSSNLKPAHTLLLFLIYLTFKTVVTRL
ncbi:COBRA-like protein 1 isoform X1 [Herrania umbratica]|uniref:COBRA-like protein n=2 Tax=Herrania umbratica TaxID=108875 RepID=A0A6J1AGP4_9ROSI|nr:COBRA-like protein 1 isoform X1 [Herrania umbratica]